MNTKFLKYLMLFTALLTSGWFIRTAAQTTEGTDFWVTFMQADQDPNNELVLQLSISSRKDCEVTIANPYTSYEEKVSVKAGATQLVNLYTGNVLAYNARTAMAETGKVCYAVNSEQVDTCALHVTASENISLFATNYKKATFDATNVLPTTSLLDEYIIQTFTPSDHGGSGSTQGSHFAVIAAEDDVVVDYCCTVKPKSIKDSNNTQWNVGDTLTSPALKKGQVFYVWTGKTDGAEGDLSGTYVKARDGKKIAVFQGCPHTNIPYQIKQRDHIFSQAMPIKYWGNTFVLTASRNRPADFIRIMALNDQTDVRINGETVHTFDFSKEQKHYWEFEIGEYGDYAKDGSCMVTTSCPCAVHLFLASQQYHGDKNSNGDPAMLWINPIEQQIDEVTFATYGSSNGTTYHYTNVVTDQPANMLLDGNSIASSFLPVSGSTTYYYSQLDLGTTSSGSTGGTHTLQCKGGNFIAHVYGFTENESYAYSAGGATKELKQVVTINGKEFTPDTQNQLCGIDTVLFECDLNYSYESITWDFGDGEKATNTNSIKHYYAKDGIYQASVIIERNSANLCHGQLAKDVIPITVTIGRMRIYIDSLDQMICSDKGSFRIYYSNPMEASLSNGNVFFNDAAKANGFTDADNLVFTDKYFEISVPENAKSAQDYALNIVLESDCGNDTVSVPFTLNYNTSLNIAQRANDILAVYNKDYNELHLNFIAFQWYRNGEPLEGEINSYLNLQGQFDYESEFYVCLKTATDSLCSCPTKFVEQSNISVQGNENITISSTTLDAGGDIYITTKEEGTYNWYDATGKLLKSGKLPVGGAIITAPDKKGLSLLSIKAEDKRNFKVIIK